MKPRNMLYLLLFPKAGLYLCSARTAAHQGAAFSQRLYSHHPLHSASKPPRGSRRESELCSRSSGRKVYSYQRDCKDQVARRHSCCNGSTPHGIWHSRTHLHLQRYCSTTSTCFSLSSSDTIRLAPKSSNTCGLLVDCYIYC